MTCSYTRCFDWN